VSRARAATGLIALLVVLSPRAALAQQDPAAWTGTWAALGQGIDLALRVELAVRDGRLVGLVNEEGNVPGYDASCALIGADRLELIVSSQTDDEPPAGRIVLSRDADGLTVRVVEGVLDGRRLGRLALRKRGEVWLMARSDVLDLAHADEGGTARAMRRSLDEAEAIEEGLRSAARADVLDDAAQSECVRGRLSDVHGAASRVRQRAEALARAATGSLCDAAAAAPPAASADAACDRVVVQDADGATTVRQAPRSSSASRGSVPNGTSLEIVERRGGWSRVRGAAEGWVHQGNLRCAASTTPRR
jgi:hypothetical protein